MLKRKLSLSGFVQIFVRYSWARGYAMGCSFIDPTLDCYYVVKAKWMEMDDYGETLMNIHAGLCTYAGQWSLKEARSLTSTLRKTTLLTKAYIGDLCFFFSE